MIIAIDGPAGSGKSSVAKAIARALGFSHIDTGAIYRALAYMALQTGVDPHDEKALANLARDLPIRFVPTADGQQVWLGDQDVSKVIRTEAISQGSSVVSQHALVRQALLALQRRLGKEAPKGAVLEGRDIGTVIFPDATLKFFLTASNEARATRRFNELQKKGEQTSFDDVLKEIVQRDTRDQTRQAAPLVAAPDAILIDTTHDSLLDVVENLLAICRKKL